MKIIPFCFCKNSLKVMSETLIKHSKQEMYGEFSFSSGLNPPVLSFLFPFSHLLSFLSHSSSHSIAIEIKLDRQSKPYFCHKRKLCLGKKKKKKCFWWSVVRTFKAQNLLRIRSESFGTPAPHLQLQGSFHSPSPGFPIFPEAAGTSGKRQGKILPFTTLTVNLGRRRYPCYTGDRTVTCLALSIECPQTKDFPSFLK